MGAQVYMKVPLPRERFGRTQKTFSSFVKISSIACFKTETSTLSIFFT